jgi:hypothetical protein
LDGDFDEKSVPFGGPYPNSREWLDQDDEEKQKNKQTTDVPPHPSQQYDPWGHQRGWR